MLGSSNKRDLATEQQTEGIGLPGGSVVKNPPIMQETRVWSVGSRRSVGGGKWQPAPVFLPGESNGQKSLAGYSPWCYKRTGHNLESKQWE